MVFFIEHFPLVGLNGRGSLLLRQYIPLSFFISHFHNTQRAVRLKAFTRKKISSVTKSRNWILSKTQKVSHEHVHSTQSASRCVLRVGTNSSEQNSKLLSCCTHFWFCLSVAAAAAAAADPGESESL